MPKSGPATRIVAPAYCGWLSTKSGSLRQAANSPSSKPVLGHPLEVDGRDDLVGVDVAAPQRQRGPGVGGERVHVSFSSALGCADQRRRWRSARGRPGSSACPAPRWRRRRAGETRCVRPPLPWRPSKLRFEVEAERSPGASWSGFMPRHIEHPAARHSAPASLNTTSSPSDSACSRTRMEPGTTSIRTQSATWWPRRTSAAARRSSIRPFVQEPRNTVSTAISRIGVPALRSMYSRALFGGRPVASSASPRGPAPTPERHALAGVRAPGDERGQLGRRRGPPRRRRPRRRR